MTKFDKERNRAMSDLQPNIVDNPAEGTTPLSFGAGSTSVLVRLGVPLFSSEDGGTD